MRRLALAAVVVVATSSAFGQPRLELQPGPALQGIAKAASIEDVARREEAMRQALRDSLLHSDPSSRVKVLAYLEQNARWIDFTPYADVLHAFAKTDPVGRGLWLLDEAELAHSPRDHQVAILRKAIVEGEIKLANGRPVTRVMAMALAARDGMDELRTLVRKFESEVDGTWRKSFNVASLEALFELTAGGRDREDALRVATQHLSDMTDPELAERMQVDPAFRGAVFQVADDVCDANPFSGVRNPGCRTARSVLDRQLVHARESGRKDRDRSAQVPDMAPDHEADWLDSLRRRLY